MKFILNTAPDVGDLKEILECIYSQIYVARVMKNPLYTPGQPFNFSQFTAQLNEYLKAKGLTSWYSMCAQAAAIHFRHVSITPGPSGTEYYEPSLERTGLFQAGLVCILSTSGWDIYHFRTCHGPCTSSNKYMGQKYSISTSGYGAGNMFFWPIHFFRLMQQAIYHHQFKSIRDLTDWNWDRSDCRRLENRSIKLCVGSASWCQDCSLDEQCKCPNCISRDHLLEFQIPIQFNPVTYRVATISLFSSQRTYHIITQGFFFFCFVTTS